MKRKTIWIVVACLLVASLVLASCSTGTTSTAPATSTPIKTTTQTTVTTSNTPVTTAASTTPVTSATQTHWWDSMGTPQYGGTLTYRVNADPAGFDAYIRRANPWDIFQSAMGGINWTVNPNIWDYKGKWAPDDIKAGDLVESYEIPDLATYIFHLHQGVHFANDPNSAASQLVNGRELTADDVVFTYNRFCGLAGWKPATTLNATFYTLTSVTAVDKYTVKFKFSAPSGAIFDAIMDPVTSNAIIPHEVVEKYGDMNNWRNAVGTGAYMLKDYVSGSAGTYQKNPNYFGYDERYPQNHLPYIDQIKLLIIPDTQTALAALRTGKIDVVETLTWDQAVTIKKTSPWILWQTRTSFWYTVQERNDKTPFTDIRVRQALTQSVDLPAIAKGYFGSAVDGVPVGIMSTSMTGWYIPYAQWPQSLKDQYAYNPTAAKQLLAAAGFPSGFKTNIVVPTNQDLGLMQIYKSYFAAVGIDMEIRPMDYTAFTNFTTAGKHDQMMINSTIGNLVAPTRMIQTFYSKNYSDYAFVNDTGYDTLVDQFNATNDIAQQRLLLQQADMYSITHFYYVQGLPTVENIAYTPWFKGFNGEVFGYWSKKSMAHYWIDQSVKKSMGY